MTLKWLSSSNRRSVLQWHRSSWVPVQLDLQPFIEVTLSPDSWNAWQDESQTTVGCQGKINFHFFVLMTVLHIYTLLQNSSFEVSVTSSGDILGFEVFEWFIDLYIYLFFREIPLHILKDSTKSLFSCLHAASEEAVVIQGIKEIT